MPEFLVLRYSTIYDFQAKAVGDHCKQAKTGRTKTTANTGHFECSCGSFTLICGRPSPAGESSIPGDQLREGIFDSRDPAIRGRPDNRRLGEHKQACKAPLSAAIRSITSASRAGKSQITRKFKQIFQHTRSIWRITHHFIAHNQNYKHISST